MSEVGDEKPRVAPPPPPPPEVKKRLEQESGGFQALSHKKVLVEVALVAALVLALGAGTFAFAGALAAWMTPLIPIGVDRTLGEVSHSGMGVELCPNPKGRRYVERLAEPLLAAAEPLPFEFSFQVADDPSINAYALPGGFVTVNRGLLESAQTGEEVAGVLGHEIQHALLRHGTRRVLRQMGGYMVLSLLTGGSDLHGMSEIAGRLTSLSYDRDQEAEADRVGVSLLVDAGIDPRGLSAFFARLQEESSAAPHEFLSTHPDPGRRATLVAEAARGQDFVELPAPPDEFCH